MKALVRFATESSGEERLQESEVLRKRSVRAALGHLCVLEWQDAYQALEDHDSQAPKIRPEIGDPLRCGYELFR